MLKTLKIIVNKYNPSVKGEFIVLFNSEFGNAEGFWANNSPKIGLSYEVEIDFIGEIIWEVNARNSADLCPRLEKNGNLTSIVAQLESIEEDGCCVLKIVDSIIFAEIKNIPNLALGKFIEMEVDSIKLYDTNI